MKYRLYSEEGGYNITVNATKEQIIAALERYEARMDIELVTCIHKLHSFGRMPNEDFIEKYKEFKSLITQIDELVEGLK